MSRPTAIIPFNKQTESFDSTFPVALENVVEPDSFYQVIDGANKVVSTHMPLIKIQRRSVLATAIIMVLIALAFVVSTILQMVLVDYNVRDQKAFATIHNLLMVCLIFCVSIVSMVQTLVMKRMYDKYLIEVRTTLGSNTSNDAVDYVLGTKWWSHPDIEVYVSNHQDV